MKYNFYDRKDEAIPKEQSDWIDANIESISNKENVLFVFQADYEALLFTDSSIYFPNRKTRRKISYNEIHKVRIAGDVLVELVTIYFEVYSIVLVTSIDKVKIFQVLKLLANNFKKGINTTFEDTHKVLSEFTVLKHPPNQSQHKLPQVYLKQFGYLDGEQWKVSILQKGENFSRQKSIGSFTAVTNVFDIESEDDRLPRIFETLNADIENLYHEMLDDISNNSVIPDKCWEIIVQLTPNLMVRSDYWRDIVSGMLNSPYKENFLNIAFSVYASSFEELQELKKKHFYKVISEGEVTQSKLNQALLHFLNYIFDHLKSFDLVVIEAPEGREFFTSDNPVNFRANQEKGKMGWFSKDTEVFFPLSKKYLVYFYHQVSEKESTLRKLKNRGVYKAEEVLTEVEYGNLVKEEIIANSDQFIIAPGKMNYRRAK
jgi:hypothetical protein